MLPADGPPLDPSSDEAHRWLLDELRKGQYSDDPSVFDRVRDWVNDLLRRLFEGSGSVGGVPTWLFVAVAAVLLVGVAYAVVRGVRVDRRVGRTKAGGVLDGPRMTAAQYRQLADTAVAEARWDDAILAGFRAVAVAAVERDLLDNLPGRTAHEVAEQLGPWFPAEAPALREAADLFDRVRYGHLPVDEAHARSVVDTDRRVAAARPQAPVAEPLSARR